MADDTQPARAGTKPPSSAPAAGSSMANRPADQANAASGAMGPQTPDGEEAPALVTLMNPGLSDLYMPGGEVIPAGGSNPNVPEKDLEHHIVKHWLGLGTVRKLDGGPAAAPFRGTAHSSPATIAMGLNTTAKPN